MIGYLILNIITHRVRKCCRGGCFSGIRRGRGTNQLFAFFVIFWKGKWISEFGIERKLNICGRGGIGTKHVWRKNEYLWKGYSCEFLASREEETMSGLTTLKQKHGLRPKECSRQKTIFLFFVLRVYGQKVYMPSGFTTQNHAFKNYLRVYHSKKPYVLHFLLFAPKTMSFSKCLPSFSKS